MFKVIGIGLLIALVLGLGVVGFVLAQGPAPTADPLVQAECPPCPCEGRLGSGPRGGQRPEALAEALGMTTEELRDALADGQTVAELAETQGVALEDVVTALVEPTVERLQQAVANGRLTQEQADERITTMKEHLLERLESGMGGGPGMGGFGGHPGRMRGGRWGGEGPGFRFPQKTTPPVEQ